jgi:hypothetical protein
MSSNDRVPRELTRAVIKSDLYGPSTGLTRTPRNPPGVPRAVGQVKELPVRVSPIRNPTADNRRPPNRENLNSN